MIAGESSGGHFRHYIYGVSGEYEEFLTTTLSKPSALEWASKHLQLFDGRFDFYSIRLVDKEVAQLTKT